MQTTPLIHLTAFTMDTQEIFSQTPVFILLMIQETKQLAFFSLELDPYL